MKRFFTKSNCVFLILIIFALYRQYPTIVNNFSAHGKQLEARDLYTIPEGKLVQFPPESKALAIFWMTTCGPCKIEMARLKSSVENGKIQAQSIYAINPFESRSQIKQFITKNDYPFTFLEDRGTGLELGVNSTPTSVFLNKGKI
ncbi:MAG: TlpA family protein disulfide reductase, partial [Bacteriovoracaceae bacterium]|nr:TlpA family protein disulfide reductase [Bacteriovoracaceae bacterium]